MSYEKDLKKQQQNKRKEQVDEKVKDYLERACDISDEMGFKGLVDWEKAVIEIAKMIQKEQV